ncbi:hypothetical protein HMPREF1406_01496 [Helicobacter pylori GAM239Bi]|nr:hypothetical protein HMPREF1406_01496 [Helicobacter pylori GAM239Bi]EMJ40057.1 hypothetical protein HMPREF1433_01030 [Helicobacter pylori GAMchJs117Ai]
MECLKVILSWLYPSLCFKDFCVTKELIVGVKRAEKFKNFKKAVVFKRDSPNQ